ncbi:MAG: NAD+ synthase [Candidatus Omnitrophica bacterium]|nr:NAD+ synthase [Candidatus Omnitrophota bacterium]
MAKEKVKENLRIALAQINCTVGDLEGNKRKISRYIETAKGAGADIVIFPELAVTGYPPEDLLLKPRFISDNINALKELSRAVNDDIVAVVGFVDRQEKSIYNAAAVIYDGKVRGIYRKSFLPNYGVFDEKRYFTPGNNPLIFKAGKVLFGVNICEDIWHDHGPTEKQVALGAGIIFNINASPYHAGKIKERREIVRRQAKTNGVIIAYANLIGGQDELVFDGQSMVVDAKGRIIAKAEAFKEDLLIFDLDIPLSKGGKGKQIIELKQAFPPKQRSFLQTKDIKPLDTVEEVYQALLLGLKDYVGKNGFQKVIIGLSGGIDSALVAALAKDALGKDNVTGVFMPSRYSSNDSEADAVQLAQNLGIKILTIPIEPIYKIYLMVLEPHFLGLQKNIAEENLQARIRGNVLMALSNKFGWLVLTTGNKSEMSTGYATLYGDMAGGFAVIKDVPKVLVYKLARYRNSLGFVIPERVLTKEPTAELKPDQKDSDSLPVYDTLDPILKAYVEDDKGLSFIVSSGFEADTVKKVMNLVDKSEYKRRQSPPGIKITPKAFGRDRRMPITNKYREYDKA